MTIYERLFIFFTSIQLIFLLSMIITGSKFMLQTDLNTSEYFVQFLHQAFTVQFVIFIFLILIFFVFGIVIIRKRNCHIVVYMCFGVSVLFFGFIPLMVTSSPFILLKNMDQDLIDEMCLMDPDQDRNS